MPIVIGLYTVIGVFRDYLVKTVKCKVRYQLIGSSRLFVNKILTVYSIYAVLCVHRNTCIPYRTAPNTLAYGAVFTLGGKSEGIVIGLKGKYLADFIRCFVIFLLKRVVEDILFRRYEGRGPSIACRIGYEHLIASRGYGVYDLTVGNRFTVYRNTCNRRINICIAIFPRYRYVTVRFAVKYIVAPHVL